MTRDETIRMLKAKLECMTRDVSGRDSDCIDRRCDECTLNYEQGNMGEQKECLKISIEALEAQPSEDCVSREAVLDGLASIAKVKAKSDAQKSLMGRVMFFTEHLPSVTPQPKTGHWVKYKHNGKPYFKCSECLYFAPIGYSYCPNCGAKMQEVQK